MEKVSSYSKEKFEKINVLVQKLNYYFQLKNFEIPEIEYKIKYGRSYFLRRRNKIILSCLNSNHLIHEYAHSLAHQKNNYRPIKTNPYGNEQHHGELFFNCLLELIDVVGENYNWNLEYKSLRNRYNKMYSKAKSPDNCI